MKLVVLTGLALTAFAAFAGPAGIVPGSVVLSKNVAGSPVTVSYELAEAPAVVTFSVETNEFADGSGVWTALPRALLANVSGDVNRRVEVGKRSFRWNPSGLFDTVVRKQGARAVVRVWPVSSPPDWMVVDSVAGVPVSFYETKDEFPGGFGDPVYKTTKLVMRRIPAAGATFRMGSPTWEESVFRNAVRERPHLVSFTNDFYLGVYEVTRAQWKSLNGKAMDDDASVRTNMQGYVTYDDIRGKNLSPGWPATGRDVVGSGSWLAGVRARTGVLLDLPTEAEWEYACRAGTRGAYNVNGLWQNDVGWFQQSTYKPVGLKPSNRWGLHDMHGNAYEWCLDWFEDAVSDGSPVVEPVGPASSSVAKRATRGGSYGGNGNGRSASRNGKEPALGTNEYGLRLWAPCQAN